MKTANEPWICPFCKRKFSSANQSHSCATYPLEHHFEKRPGWYREAFDNITRHLIHKETVSVTSLKNTILFADRCTFLAFKPKAGHIDLEFVLSEEHNLFPIHKTIRISKNRVAHFVAIDSADQIDQHMIGLINAARMVAYASSDNQEQ